MHINIVLQKGKKYHSRYHHDMINISECKSQLTQLNIYFPDISSLTSDLTAYIYFLTQFTPSIQLMDILMLWYYLLIIHPRDLEQLELAANHSPIDTPIECFRLISLFSKNICIFILGFTAFTSLSLTSTENARSFVRHRSDMDR